MCAPPIPMVWLNARVMMYFDLSTLRSAARLIYQSMPPTPQYAWPLLAERLGMDVIVKHENHTPTGAFKVRGGLVYFDWLKRQHQKANGVISATRGNHGQSLAFAGRQHGIAVKIVVPHGNSVEKNAAMRAFGGEVIEHGVDFDEAREEAQRLADLDGLWMVPSYDPLLVRGVATYGLELFEQISDIDTVYVPIGLGSGISGLIHARDLLGLKTKIVGVVTEQLPAYALSFERGELVTTESAHSIADGMATRIPVAAALEVIRAGAERIVRISDRDIIAAMRIYYTDTHNLAEGAGAAALAALMREKTQMAGKRVAVILCGGNIDLDWFQGALFAKTLPDQGGSG